MHAGSQTSRAGVDFEGCYRAGPHEFELKQEAGYRHFLDSGDYAISSDYVGEYFRVGYTRRLDDRFSLRLRHVFDGRWHADPDPYNLDAWSHQPRVDLRYRTEDLDHLQVGYRFTHRSVPDSSSLGYDRHTIDAEASWRFGGAASFDVTNQLERRGYEEVSVRESSWENRTDLRLELGSVERISYRVTQAYEVVRFDEPDELDHDYDYSRTGFQVELHATPQFDFAVRPLYSFLATDVSPFEEYAEVGFEVSFDWRSDFGVWMNVAQEVGRRDYELSATESERDLDSLASVDELLTFDSFGAYSDYTFYRLSLLLTVDLSSGLSSSVFVNWQPENHQVSRYDSNSRLVSGSVDYRF